MLLAEEAARTVAAEPYEHPIWGSGFRAVNIDTVRNTAVAFGFLVLLAMMVRTQLKRDRPTPLQNLLEWFVDGIRGLINQTLGDRDVRLAPIAITLFAFILVCNLVGLVPFLKSPTNDVNTAMALAIFTIGMVHFQSVRFRGRVGYVSHYFSVVTPRWGSRRRWLNVLGLSALFAAVALSVLVIAGALESSWIGTTVILVFVAGGALPGAVARIIFGMIEILIEITKPFTLAFRLYFNIFVGELLLAILIFLLAFLSPLIGGGWIFFSIFVGIIQAFIFTMLTISYIAQSTETHHDDPAQPTEAAVAK